MRNFVTLLKYFFSCLMVFLLFSEYLKNGFHGSVIKILFIFCFLVFLVFFIARYDFLLTIHNEIKSKNNRFGNFAFLLNMFILFFYSYLFNVSWFTYLGKFIAHYYVVAFWVGSLAFIIPTTFFIYLSDKNKEERVMRIANIILIILVLFRIFLLGPLFPSARGVF